MACGMKHKDPDPWRLPILDFAEVLDLRTEGVRKQQQLEIRQQSCGKQCLQGAPALRGQLHYSLPTSSKHGSSTLCSLPTSSKYGSSTLYSLSISSDSSGTPHIQQGFCKLQRTNKHQDSPVPSIVIHII
eukprot:1158473-Pelagomonas_calceolata.AAC.10